MPRTSDAKPISKMARAKEPWDHWAIINENPFPTPLVTMALFMMPMAVSKIAVKTAARMPLTKDSAIRVGPISTGLNRPLLLNRAPKLVIHEVTISAAMAQHAA